MVVLDVGARAAQLKRWKAFRGNLHYFGFEPDAQECSRLNKAASNDSNPWEEQYIPIALGRDAESRKFYVTDSAACSSLLEPNLEALDGFSVKDPMSVVDVTTVETVGLSQWAAKQGIDRVDFVKLDIQGAELEVLKSGENLVDSALGVEIEVEFIELYKRQPMFSDVDAWIRPRGFILFDISRVYSKRVCVSELVETKGQLTWGDALYLKDIESLFAAGGVNAPVLRTKQVLKLAAIADLYCRPDYSLYVLKSAANRTGYLGDYSELVDDVILKIMRGWQQSRDLTSRFFRSWFASRFSPLLDVVFPEVFKKLEATMETRKKEYRWKVCGW
jgi:FkbM family methyltransferase